MQNLNTNSIIIYMLFIGLILFSCNHKKDKQTVVGNDQIEEIKVDLKKSKDIALSDFAEEVQYIKLETTEESQFAGIYKLIVNSNGIFILDQIISKKIFYFSPQGKFINTIGKTGRGPEEYQQVNDFIVDTVNNTVEIIDGMDDRFIYCLNGDFLRRDKFRKGLLLSRFYKLPNNNYLVKKENFAENIEYLFALLQPDLSTTVKEFIIPPGYPIDFAPSLCFSNPIDNTILFTYGLGDTIYQYKNESVKALYSVNYGKARVPDEIRNEKDDVEIFVLLAQPANNFAGYYNNLIWNQTHVFFEVFSQRKVYICCYNKQKRENSIYSNIIGKDGEIYSKALRTIHNGNLIFSLEAVDISSEDKTDNSQQDQKYGVFSSFKEIQKNTLPGDNSVLALIRPKSDI